MFFLYIYIVIWNTTNGDFMYYYINNFVMFSILGHIVETVFYTIGSGESGILYGYWTPIYGFGCVFILFMYNHLITHRKFSKWVENILIFLTGAVFLTLLEYLAGTLIEYFFDTIFWSYENLPFHIGKYISVEMALVWGIASLVLIRFLKPLFDFIEKRIPKWLTWIFIILFIIDVLATLYFKVL